MFIVRKICRRNSAYFFETKIIFVLVCPWTYRKPDHTWITFVCMSLASLSTYESRTCRRRSVKTKLLLKIRLLVKCKIIFLLVDSTIAKMIFMRICLFPWKFSFTMNPWYIFLTEIFKSKENTFVCNNS